MSLSCVSSACTTQASTDQNSAYVEYVYDGDTVSIRQLGNAYKLRLSNIDAPELNQPGGKIARRALINLCMNQPIIVDISGEDKYHRQLGNLQCNQTNTSQYLVEHGYAWHYAQYSHDAELVQAEHDAKENKCGLWAKPDPTPPWVWRKSYPHYYKNNAKN